MRTADQFDRLSKAIASKETLGDAIVAGFGLTVLVPLLALAHFFQQSTRIQLVTDEDSCYAAGGYVVEIQSRPIVDWCCVCETTSGAICPDAAPKAVFEATDRSGLLRARDVTCLLAGDKRAVGCTATCTVIAVRKSFTGFGG